MHRHPVHHQTPQKDIVPLKTKIAFGMGGAADTLMSNGVSNLASYVYNIGLGVNPVLVSLALSLPRIWEAFTDPFMGYISDNHRSRFGRRRPFMFLGAVLCAILFPLIWFVPRGWGANAQFYYLLASSILFYTAYTVFTIPYNAMGCEITQDYHERTRVMTYRSLVSTCVAFCLAWLFALAKLEIFRDIVDGARWVGIGVGVVMLACGIIPALFGKENYSAEVQGQDKISLAAGMRESLRNKPFLMLIFIVIFMLIGIFSIGTIGAYLNIYYVYGGDMKPASVMNGWGSSAYLLASLMATPIVSMLGTRYGKKETLSWFLFIALAGALSKWFCYTPAHPFLQLVPNVLIGTGFTALWVLVGSMLPDLCDFDELKSGLRREGLYGAVYGWVSKLGTSLAFFLSGVTLDITGFNVSLGGNQTAHTILWMRILAVIVPAVATFIAIVLVRLYPITESAAYDIRARLNEHRSRYTPIPGVDPYGTTTECGSATTKQTP